MSSEETGESAKALPTAVIANDPAFQYQAMVDRETDEVTLVLVNPAGTKFALKFDIATAVLLTRLDFVVRNIDNPLIRNRSTALLAALDAWLVAQEQRLVELGILQKKTR
jgi:hypothetical protein